MTSYNTATLYLKQQAQVNQKNQQSTTVLGNYEIVRKSIGKGSFSKIYLGTCLKTKKQVAIKIIKKRNIKNENNILREIQIMKMIKHPNVVKLIDVLASNNKYYLILEYCSNGDLKDFSKNRDINEDILRNYMTQIRNGLYELYTKHIIHRDLKPHNILVTHDNKLKISDFGFAKSYDPDKDLQQTMCGSPLYMAPEILEGNPYTNLADLWSVGVIMYELFYGIVPIHGQNIADLIINIRKFVYTSSNKPISDECNDLLRKLLQTDPKKRITWNHFISHSWFRTTPCTIDNIYYDSHHIEHNYHDNENDNENYNENYNENDNENGSNSLLFQMEDVDTDEHIQHIEKYESDVNCKKRITDDSLHMSLTDSHTNIDLDIDLDETVMFRSGVNIKDAFLRPVSEKKYIVNEIYDDNYVIITSPSEMDIYTRSHLKSYDSRENESEYDAHQSAKYVHLKRIFNSLKDSISSFIFRPKSI